jgi:UDP-glucuronate 4-epimerase
MTRILVTGGAGFIGSHTTELLLTRGNEVICLDNFNDYYDPARKRKNVAPFEEQPHYQLYEGDIRNAEVLETIFAAHQPDKVIHIAAMANVRYSIQHPELYESVNVRGLMNTLETARRHGVSNFVFASSSCLRFFTVYGPRGRPDMAPYLFTRWVFDGEPLKMFGDGTTYRDYTYIDDIVAGVVAALDADLPYEIINLGNSQTVMLRDFIGIVEELVGRKANVVQLPPQLGDVPRTYADVSKARRLLGYDPKTPFAEGMARFVAWYRREVRGE